MTTPTPRPSRPRAFRLDDPHIVVDRQAGRQPEPSERQPRPTGPQRETVVVEPQPDAYEREASAAGDRTEAAIEVAQRGGMAARRRWSWGGVFWSALGSLVSLAVGLWLTTLIEALFAQAPALGWVGVALAGFAAVALCGLLVREAAGMARQSRIAKLHAALASARATDNRDAARRLVHDLARLYAARPETARVRAEILGLTREIVDGRDLIDIAERGLMHPLDKRVSREIATAAKRVSVVTAVSPRAIVDVVFVVGQAVHVIRRIAEIYGGRPGLLGFFKLLRSVTAHLVITGGMAVGDSIIQQFLGHGIASRISARLGEGVLNGLLTARIGLSAMAVCRPMPFAAERAPGVREVAPFLFTARKE